MKMKRKEGLVCGGSRRAAAAALVAAVWLSCLVQESSGFTTTRDNEGAGGGVFSQSTITVVSASVCGAFASTPSTRIRVDPDCCVPQRTVSSTCTTCTFSNTLQFEGDATQTWFEVMADGERIGDSSFNLHSLAAASDPNSALSVDVDYPLQLDVASVSLSPPCTHTVNVIVRYANSGGGGGGGGKGGGGGGGSSSTIIGIVVGIVIAFLIFLLGLFMFYYRSRKISSAMDTIEMAV